MPAMSAPIPIPETKRHAMTCHNSVLVAVISEAMADRFWPGEDALDRHFEFIREEGVQRQVVGIVGNSQ